MVFPILMIPGPTNLSDQVLRVMSDPMLGHTSPQFYEDYKEAQMLSAKLFGSEEDKTVLFSGSGTFGIEAGISTFLKDGDKVLSLVNGYFGDRFAKIAEIYGIKVKTVSFPDGMAADPDTLKRELQMEKYDAVSMTHIDTSTGVMNDIISLGNIAKEYGAYVFVDLVSSLGGSKFRFDDGPFDYAYSASQKCIAAPPGASLIAISDDLLKRSHDFKPKSYYFNLKMWLDVMKDPKIYLTTPTIPVIRALKVALKELFEEGLEARIRRHEEMG
ncbi:MAG: alanine--glyoxylate aminotransferase family protein, partial [Conexivisphaerales archaeon]